MEIDPSYCEDYDHNDDMYDKGERLSRRVCDAAPQEMFLVAIEIKEILKKSRGVD